MTTVTLTASQFLADLKDRLKSADRDFAKNPNSSNWRIRLQLGFVYQQATYLFNSRNMSVSTKQMVLDEIANDPDGNCFDIICMRTLGVKLAPALKEFAL